MKPFDAKAPEVRMIRMPGAPTAVARFCRTAALMLVAPVALAAVARAQTYEVVRSFTPTPDGASPYGGVVQATDGNFYGTTTSGGAAGHGTIYKMDAAGTITTLHSFTGADGDAPYAAPVQAVDGSFYGTTVRGGAADRGTVYRLDTTGTLTTLHSFSGPDGDAPYAALIQATDGRFYGTTSRGGPSDAGTIFKVDAD